MSERKSRKAGTSRKGKKRTDVVTNIETLLVKDVWERTFDSIPDLIVVLDNRHRIVRANKSMAQRLGVNPEQCIGLNCFKCVHKLDAPPSFCPHSLTIADGKEHSAEVHEDNLGGDFLVSTTPLFDSQGQIIGSVHVTRDITQRKKAEEEIKSLSRFPAENPNVVMRISKDGNVLYSNDAGLSILNEWKCQIGQPVPSEWRQLVTDVLKSGIKKELEEEHDAQTFLIMLAPVVDEGYVNVYGREITKRKKAERSLLESQFDLNRAQAVAMTGSWRLDVRSNALLWSDETYRMFGIPKGTSLTYETFLNFVHPDDREYVDQQWQAALRGEPYDIEHRIIVDGKVKWVREKAELELNKDGVLLGGFGTVQDVTEKREMHAKLEEYSRHLEELVEEKTQKLKEAERLITIGETAGMVGHDIRNPLQSIEGAVYLAKEELQSLPADSPEKKELHGLLEIIRRQTGYIDRIVADLQDFSRTPMVQLRETNLRELITDALSMTEIPENIQVQTLIQEDHQTVQVDSVSMKRVLLNLIENAAHAMPNGGELTIKAFKQDECTCIHVKDTGICIPEENKPKIFTPLFTTKAKGQGFGLAVCKKLVEAHKGEITFESEAGKGTVFKIKLPQRKEAV